MELVWRTKWVKAVNFSELNLSAGRSFRIRHGAGVDGEKEAFYSKH